MRDSIPICRSILKHWIFQDAEYLKVWLTMLAKARYIREPKKVMYQGTLHEVNYGEFIFGRPTWCKDLKISENRLRKLMNLLVEENMIELVKKTGKSTIYRITNYEKFNQQDNQQQDQQEQEVEEFDNQQDNQQITDRPPTDNQQTTNKEESIRKIKKDKKDIYRDFTDNEDLISTLKDFAEMRKSIKKPMTEKAMKLMMIELNKCADNDADKIAVLNQSIVNSWQGVFPLKKGDWDNGIRGKPTGDRNRLQVRDVDKDQGNIPSGFWANG